MATTTAPYWLDYLARERTMCSICKSVDGAGWVRIGDPIPRDFQRPGRLAAFRAKQKAAFRRHVAALHPDLKVRWTR